MFGAEDKKELVDPYVVFAFAGNRVTRSQFCVTLAANLHKNLRYARVSGKILFSAFDIGFK